MTIMPYELQPGDVIKMTSSHGTWLLTVVSVKCNYDEDMTRSYEIRFLKNDNGTLSRSNLHTTLLECISRG